MMRTTQYVSE